MNKQGKKISFKLVVPTFLPFRLDVWPFILIYGVLGYLYFDQGEEEDNIYIKLTIIGVLFLHCLLYIFGHWSPKVKSLIQYSTIRGTLQSNLEKASHVYIIQDKPGRNRSYAIVDFCATQYQGSTLYFFHFEQRKFYYNTTTKQFERMKPNIKGKTVKQLIELSQTKKLSEFGEQYDSNILQIPIRPFWDIVRDQIVDPFSFFQLFSVFLWMMDQNRVYSLMILVMLLISAFTIATQRIKTLVSYRSMTLAPQQMHVYRDEKWFKASSYELRPNDIVIVQPGYKAKKIEYDRLSDSEFLKKSIPFSSHLPGGLIRTTENDLSSQRAIPCDMLILSGSCIADESILTGQAIPQIKDSGLNLSEDQQFNVNKHKQCVLFCGTEVLQITDSTMDSQISFKSKPPISGCLALVLRTGYDTSKGKLIRRVISNTNNLNIQQKDGLFVILFLLICSLFTASYVLNKGLQNEERDKNKLFLRCILIITTVVPPELPMILTLAVNNSILYLQKKRIFVTQPQRIPLGGMVDIVAFDKTGTLTSDKFVFQGIVDSCESYQNLKKIELADKNSQTVLAGCHSLLSAQGKLIGDPIELLFFEQSNWDYSSHNKQARKTKGGLQRIQIKNIFPFRSDIKRMSTKVTHVDEKGRQSKLLVKGAPEVIRDLLTNVPKNYDQAYTYYTSQGLRVLALAHRILTEDLVNIQQRKNLQKQLVFTGFMVCNSPLKQDTLANIKSLQQAKYRVIMITGDNLLTAANVGKQIQLGSNIMILQNVNGKIVAKFDKQQISIQNLNKLKSIISKNSLVCTSCTSELPQSYLPYITVFARTSPSEKQYIVKSLKDLTGKKILYAGDGTNDVGGLRAADVGIAVVGVNNLVEIHDKQQSLKNKQEEFKKKMNDLKTDFSLTFKQRMQRTAKLMKQNAQNRQSDFMNLNSEIKFGDACIAAPFTSKHSNSIYCVQIVIRQAISTLVTAIQTYKILGISSLLQAYALAEMNMESLKYSQRQSTVLGILGAINFYFFSNAKPMKKISDVRAPSTIFNFWFLLSLFGQAIIYLFCNYYALNHIGIHYMPVQDKGVNADQQFQRSFLNTVIFLFSAISQSIIFLVNHGGQPHLQSLLKNPKYFKFLMIPLVFCFILASNYSEGLSDLVDLKFTNVPYEANIEMIKIFGFMVGSSYILNKICKYGQFKSFFGWV